MSSQQQEEQELTLSKRGSAYKVMPPYFGALMKYFADPFNAETNPNGIINLGVAENMLCAKELANEIRKLRSTSAAVAEHTFPYGDFAGSIALRTELAKLFKKHLFMLPEDEYKIDAKHFSMTNGAGSMIEMLAGCLCNPGDLVMIPSPHYHGLKLDFSHRMQCELLAVQMKLVQDESNALHYRFDLDMHALDESYKQACEKGQKIGMFIHINPHNPTGMIFSEAQTLQLMQWCLERKIHFISDEVYGMSLFPTCSSSSAPKFVSAMHICKKSSKQLDDAKLKELVETRYKDYVHIVWSFSKDFGLNGFRLGVLYSENDALVGSMKACSYFTGISTDTDFLMTELLRDEKFIEEFIPENQKRMKEQYDKCAQFMENHKVPYVPAQGSMFIYVNLLLMPACKAKYEYSEEGEKKLWNELLDDDCKVYITPGFVFNGDKPGWFRCCVTATNFEVLEKAWNRIFAKLNK